MTSIPSARVSELLSVGYCRILNQKGVVARIDRPDWKSFMEQKVLGMPVGDSAYLEDYYRRAYSKDRVEVGPANIGLFPLSPKTELGYRPKEGDPTSSITSVFGKNQQLQSENDRLRQVITHLADSLSLDANSVIAGESSIENEIQRRASDMAAGFVCESLRRTAADVSSKAQHDYGSADAVSMLHREANRVERDGLTTSARSYKNVVGAPVRGTEIDLTV